MFRFGDRVVVEKNLIGVIVKTRYVGTSSEKQKQKNVKRIYDVYVQIYDGIKTYTEGEMHLYRPPYESLGVTEVTPEG